MSRTHSLKKNARTAPLAPSAQATDPVAALIDAKRGGTKHDDPSPEGLAALVRILAHNDLQRAPTKRVGADAAIDMLRTHFGWAGESIKSLNSLCKRALGRKSWGTP